MAKIKVVEEEKIYNFAFGRKLIRSSDHGKKYDRTQLNVTTLCNMISANDLDYP